MASEYPHFLSAVYSAVGVGPTAHLFVHLISAVVYAATVVVVFRLGDQVFNCPVAIGGAAVLSVFLDYLYGVTVVSPWTLRNYLVHGDFVLLKSIGYNFWRGNTPITVYTGISNSLSDFGPRTSATIQGLTAAAVNDLLRGEALDFIRAHPADFILRLGRKSWLLCRFYAAEQEFQVNLLRKVAYILTVLAGIVGVWLSCRRWQQVFLLYLLFVGFTAAYALFFIRPRFRVPTVQLYLFLFTSYATFQMRRHLSDIPHR